MSQRRFHKIRKLVSSNRTGDVFGITIPKSIADNFKNVSFEIKECGESLIMTSGCPTQQRGGYIGSCF